MDSEASDSDHGGRGPQRGLNNLQCTRAGATWRPLCSLLVVSACCSWGSHARARSLASNNKQVVEGPAAASAALADRFTLDHLHGHALLSANKAERPLGLPSRGPLVALK